MNTLNIVLPASLLLCGSAIAQFQLPNLSTSQTVQSTTTTSTVARNASYVRTIGASNANANISLLGSSRATITRSGSLPISGTFRVDGSATGRVRLFNVSREAARVTGFGQVGGSLRTMTGTFSAGFGVRLAGQTVYSPSYSGSYTFSPTFNRTFGNPTIFSTSASIPTPIGLSVNMSVAAGATARLQLGASLAPSQMSARLTGSASAIATGRGSVSVSALCASAGVNTDLRLMNTRLNASFTANSAGNVSGSLGYRLEAARFAATVFASLCGLSGSVQVWNVSTPLYQGTRTLN